MKNEHNHFKEHHLLKDLDDRCQYSSSIGNESIMSSCFNKIYIMKDKNESNVQYYNCDSETNISIKRINCPNKYRLQCQNISLFKRSLFYPRKRRMGDTIMVVTILSLFLMQGKFLKC